MNNSRQKQKICWQLCYFPHLFASETFPVLGSRFCCFSDSMESNHDSKIWNVWFQFCLLPNNKLGERWVGVLAGTHLWMICLLKNRKCQILNALCCWSVVTPGIITSLQHQSVFTPFFLGCFVQVMNFVSCNAVKKETCLLKECYHSSHHCDDVSALECLCSRCTTHFVRDMDFMLCHSIKKLCLLHSKTCLDWCVPSSNSKHTSGCTYCGLCHFMTNSCRFTVLHVTFQILVTCFITDSECLMPKNGNVATLSTQFSAVLTLPVLLDCKVWTLYCCWFQF